MLIFFWAFPTVCSAGVQKNDFFIDVDDLVQMTSKFSEVDCWGALVKFHDLLPSMPRLAIRAVHTPRASTL